VLDLFSADRRFTSVLGNHDLALLRYWRGEDHPLKPSQARAAAELVANPRHYREFLSSLPLMINLSDHIIVHAGLRPGIPLESQSAADLTELRTLGEDRTSRRGTPWYEVYESEKLVLFGHWPNPEPIRAPHAIGLDTGCVYGHRLTGYVLETQEFISVPAFQAYDQPRQGFAAGGPIQSG
jgi:diadenosine tetraphosphatase ApaH/serine/threonine PP2A family protein phosphatase